MNNRNDKRDNGFIVRDFMTKELGLSGGELNLYAMIYSFTMSVGQCRVSREYIVKRLSISRTSTGRYLRSLRDKGFIEKLEDENKGGIAIYRAVTPDALSKNQGEPSGCPNRAGVGSNWTGVGSNWAGVGSNWAGGVTNLDPNNKVSNKGSNKANNKPLINTTTTTTYNAGGEESEFYDVEFLGDKNEAEDHKDTVSKEILAQPIGGTKKTIQSGESMSRFAEAESQHSRDGKKDEELTESEQDALREAREADALRKLIIAYENGDKSALKKWRDVVEEFEGVRPPKDLLSDKANASSLREVLTKLNKSCGAAGGAKIGLSAAGKSSDSMKITWGRGADAFEFDLEEYYRSRGGYDSSVEAKLLELGEYKVVKMTYAQFDELVFKLGLEVVDEYVLRLERFLLSNKCVGVFSHFETIKKWVNEDLNVSV